MTSGGRNLAILGIGAVITSCVMTGVSLALYRISGDIYLDRSRPGFLPDSDEVTAAPDATTTYVFPDSGTLTRSDLDQYLRELKTITDRLDSTPDSYSPTPLSDESLGITSAPAAKDADSAD